MMANIRLDTREVDRIMSRLGLNGAEMINRIAFEVEGQAKINCPYITGALRSSLHTEAATARKMAARVADGMEYGVFVELGIARRRAKPFLSSAAENVGSRYNSGAAWEELIK